MTTGKVSTQTYNSLEQLEQLRSQWEGLLAHYPLATTFSTPEWLLSWWRSFGQHQELLAIGAFVDSSLVGFAGLSLTSASAGAIPLRILRLMSDGSQDSDNLDLPVRSGFESDFAEALVGILEAQKQRWDVGYFNLMPAQSPGVAALRQVLERKGWLTFGTNSPASAIALPETWEQYLKQLSSNERAKVGPRSRRLEKKYSVRIRKCEDPQELDALLQVLYELHRKSWQARGLPGTLHVPSRRRFYGELARSLLQKNLLEFWVLELNGKVVAAQFGFRHGTAVFCLQEGFDAEYASDSVGFVLRSQVIRNLISQGIRRYDFLGGTDEFKKRWGAERDDYFNLSFARPRSKGAAYLRSLDHSRRAKSWLRENLPAGAWSVLHKINLARKPKDKPTQG
ncbi:MAG TPA: GNAT family N-acetyltransferase [Candidatus Sulfotelmatobacter sp.]